MNNKTKIMVCDFETTVFADQQFTEVWAAACVELFSEDVKIFHSIGEQFEYFKSLDCNVIAYYHNLKFDGSFWLSYLLTELRFNQAIYENKTDAQLSRFKKNKQMSNNSFKYLISNMGSWYTFTIKVNNHIIELRDSLKLLPFSVKEIGKGFKTKHQKLEMEYEGFRYAGCEIKPEEQQYIKNDVLVVKEALEILIKKGHDRLTIGSCCLAEYKSIFGKGKFKKYFPDVYKISIDEEKYGSSNVDEYVRKSYRGGWCYLVKGKENKIFHNGITYDVNSLYPSMMSRESGNKYPIGKPTFWSGNYIPAEARDNQHYYFVRFKTRFYLRDGKLPFIQIKNNMLYRMNEMLETSDIYNYKEKQYYSRYIDYDGNEKDTALTLCMTETDFKLFHEHYIVEDFHVLDGCYFEAKTGLFDDYIDKYKEIKIKSKGAERQLAKLFLNNLYGKMASSPDSSFKIAFEKDDLSVGFYTVLEHEKQAGYIPVGSAITSYARNFTIRAAQKNYYGADKAGFIYADTDSIHCDLPKEKIKGIVEHDTNFCCWKLENTWKDGLFVRQKTYIETYNKNNDIIYDIKCAGMPAKCKNLLIDSFTQNYDDSNYNDDEKTFVHQKRNLKDFKLGLCIPSKLLPRRIRGGVVLVNTTYEMR